MCYIHVYHGVWRLLVNGITVNIECYLAMYPRIYNTYLAIHDIHPSQFGRLYEVAN